MSTLQTLDRGLLALDLISRRPAGITVAELADELGVHRAICYRIVATLEGHNLVVRADQGRIHLGAGVAAYSERFLSHLRRASEHILQELANETGATAFLSIAEGSDSVAIAVAESENAPLRVGYRVGSRHPLDRAASGRAILAMRPEVGRDSDAVRTARREGVAFSSGEIEQGAAGAAVGVVGLGGMYRLEASVGVVVIGELNRDALAEMVRHAAARLVHEF